MPDKSLAFPGSVDSHCHLTSIEEKGLSPEEILRACGENHMGGILDVGIIPDTLLRRRGRYGNNPLVRFSSGIHPSAIERSDIDSQIDLLEGQIGAEMVVAVGEIGLDYFWNTGERADQIELLERQTVLAVANDLPVIIHNRDADPDIIHVLTRLRPRGVMHCFSQDEAFCSRCLDIGMFISFGGNLTFKNSETLRAACQIVPRDRLLVETDSPYLSPQAVRGRPNHPGHLGFTIAAIAEIRNEDPIDVAGWTATNAGRCFGINSWLAA